MSKTSTVALVATSILLLHCSTRGTEASSGHVEDASRPRESSTADSAGFGDGGKKIAFVTSEGFTGDLAGAGGTTDGLMAADKLCSIAASRGNLSGTWHAWLSTSTVHAINRLPPAGGPWYSTRGTLLFASRADVQRGPMGRMDGDERGDPVPSTGPSIGAWTGTGPTGTRHEDRCDDWTSSLGSARGATGLTTGLGEAWTYFLSTSCDKKAALLCFQD